MNKSFLSWSSGKDASYALLKLYAQGKKPQLLVTNINESKKRVSMHGVRKELLEQQAKRLNIPLHIIPLDENINMKDYVEITNTHYKNLAHQGFETGYFGDIFLEDLKDFRKVEMEKAHIKAAFPIWGENTKELALQIIDSGIKAIITAVSSQKLSEDFVGANFDRNFLNNLPEGVDWCGENGEFHTFVYDHPMFSSPIPIKKGEKIFKSFKPCTNKDKEYLNTKTPKNKEWDTGFWYIDILVK